MKKKILLPILAFFAYVTPVHADEGMWLLPFIEQMNMQAMKKAGLKLKASDIYNTGGTSLKDAIVIFGGGCTGEIVSPNGLLLTNHHCGYDAIQQHSSVEHDYLRDGFWAMSQQEELPTPGLAVTFIREIRDVTAEVLKGVATDMDGKQRDSIIAVNVKTLTTPYLESKENKAKSISAYITPMFAGNQYLLFVTQRYNDVRMVGAPPSSIGKFGGDTDNWMWPRHTGDFSVFRVYADKDGNPANYSADNVPLNTPKFLEVSLKGVKEGDFSMIMGFPGRTNRYMTSWEIDQVLGQDNPIRIFVRGERQAILWEDMMADQGVRIMYSSIYARSANYWKNSIGMTRGLRRLDVKGKKEAQQQEFIDWVNASAERKQLYGQALPMIQQAVTGRCPAASTMQWINEALLNSIPPLVVTRAYSSSLLSANSNTSDSITKVVLTQVGKNVFKNYNPATERKVLARMLQVFVDSVAVADRPTALQKINSTDVPAFAAYLSDSSLFTCPQRYFDALEKFDRQQWLNDPMATLGASISIKLNELTAAQSPYAQQFATGQRLWEAGLMEMNNYGKPGGKAMAPDANFTLRLTYGNVLSYWPADANFYNYFTTLGGVIAKKDNANPEFVVPDRLVELYRSRNYGPYAVTTTINGVPKSTDVPVGLLSNNDITGGNSGSPIMDAYGRLIGLAFDGNWEAMSGDIAFEPDLQRTISVDIRYVLFIIDKYAGCTRLIDEMTIVK